MRGALASIRRTPGFAATVLVTLALGIGATTAVSSIVYGILLRPQPYPNPDRLVRVWEERPGGASPAGNRWLSRSTYALWRQRSATLDALGGYSLSEQRLAFGSDGVVAVGAHLSPAVMATLGVRPTLGRLLVDDDDRENGAPVVVISEALWRERFGADPHILGTSIPIDGIAHTVVGVAPSILQFPDASVRVWTPYVIPRSATAPGGAAVFTALARLKPGVTVTQAEAEGTAAARVAPPHRLTDFFFGTGGPPVVHARPIVEDVTAPARPALLVFVAAVMLVLLIACVNVANLILSRDVSRQRELAVRAALGGSHARLLRQLLTEAAVFTSVGSTLGLLLAWWLVSILPAIAPSSLPRLEGVTFDRRALLLWSLITIVAGIVAGLAPAVRGSSVDLRHVLSADRSSGTGFRGPQARRLRDALLIVEAAFAVILIVGASLLARSFERLIAVDSGYTAEGVLVTRVGLAPGATEAQRDRLIDVTLGRLRALESVSSAGAAEMIPLSRGSAIESFSVPEALAGGKPTKGQALVYPITTGYAEALRLRLRAGRFFDQTDGRPGELKVIVNDEFVRQHLSVDRAVGVRIPHLLGPDQVIPAEIVGVVGNVLKDGNDRRPQPELYFLHGSPGGRISGAVRFVIRTNGEPNRIAQDVGNIIRQTDPTAVADATVPLTTSLSASFNAPRFAATVVTAFACAAIALAAIGLYGVLSYSLSQRMRELAIRSALGARRADLVRLVFHEGLPVTCIGVALGVLGASMFTRLMRDLLFGIAPLDVVSFTVAPVVLILAALIGCFIAALRATATDPATLLRSNS
jgi:putative ABC transport system permease protein